MMEDCKFVSCRSERLYSEEELTDLIGLAAAMGMDVGPDSDLLAISICDLERLLRYPV